MAERSSTPRSWQSLFTERWHRSSRVVFWLALVVLLLSNVPGQYVRDIQYEVGFPFHIRESWVHGWPGTFLVREAYVHHPNPLAISPSSVYFYSPSLTDCFSPTMDLLETRWWMLVLNIACALLAAMTIGLLLEVWRRQRTRLFQIYLRDCLLASLVVSCVAAWCVHKFRPWTVEEQLRLYDNGEAFPPVTVTRQWRSSVLELTFPEQRWFEPFNRPLELQLWEQAGWKFLHHFPEARLLEIQIPATGGSTLDLAHLRDLPNLEAISFSSDLSGEDTPAEAAELPPLPNLRGLAIFIPLHRCRRLDRLTSLEYLRIGDGYIDDEALSEIRQLTKFRHLSLNGLDRGADLSFLPKLTQLTHADFYFSEFDEEGLRHISECNGLVELSLYMCKVDDTCIPYVAKLTQLRKLDVDQTQVKDIVGLQRALPNCEIND